MPLRWILIGLAIASTVAPVFGQAQQASVDAFQAVSDAGLPTCKKLTRFFRTHSI
jgi:hypothetical protein